jgi:hypothetical protein
MWEIRIYRVGVGGTAVCSVTLDCASESDEVRTDTVSLCVPIVAEDHYGSTPEMCVSGESGGLVRYLM